MPDENESLVRQAYEAYGRGDVTQMLELVDLDLEWTYLDPSFEKPRAADLPRPAGATTGIAAPGRAGPEIGA